MPKTATNIHDNNAQQHAKQNIFHWITWKYAQIISIRVISASLLFISSYLSHRITYRVFAACVSDIQSNNNNQKWASCIESAFLCISRDEKKIRGLLCRSRTYYVTFGFCKLTKFLSPCLSTYLKLQTLSATLTHS